MVEIFLISHEDVSVSLLQSAELILGTQKNVYTYSLKRGEAKYPLTLPTVKRLKN